MDENRVWRVIMTDSESLTGVAPVCPAVTSDSHRIPGSGEQDDTGVYDCCPHPHIECWGEREADELAKALTEADELAKALTEAGAAVCS